MECLCPSVHPLVSPRRKVWITYIQAYMPHESSEDSSNQPDGPMGSHRCPPWPTEWRYQKFDRNRYRDFFSDTKFSETDTETFFPIPNFPKPKPSKNWQKFRNQEVSKPKCQSLPKGLPATLRKEVSPTLPWQERTVRRGGLSPQKDTSTTSWDTSFEPLKGILKSDNQSKPEQLTKHLIFSSIWFDYWFVGKSPSS